MEKREKLTAFLLAGLFFLVSLGIEIILIKTGTVSNEALYFLLLISIVISSVYGGLEAGIFSTVLSSIVIGYSFLFIPANFGEIWVFFGGIVISLLIGKIKKTEETALQTSQNSIKNEQYLREVMNNLFIFVGVTTPEGVLLETNKSPFETSKFRFRNAINKNIKNTYWWSFSKQSKKKMKAAIKVANQGSLVRYDTWMRRNNGELIMVDFSMTPMKNKIGKIEYLAILAVDVNQRTESFNDNIKLYKELKKQKRLTDNIIADIPGVVWELSRKSIKDTFKTTFVSDYIEMMLGYKSDIYKNNLNFWNDIIFEEDKNKVLKEIDWVYRRQKQSMCRFRCVTASGKLVWVESRFTVDCDDEGRSVGVGGILFDISERVKNEKMKDDFINMASHEIRTPLATIKAFAQIIEKRVRMLDRKGAINYLSRMNVYIDRLNQLIGEFMDFSRIETGKMTYSWEVLKIDALIKEVADDMQLISESHKIFVEGKTNKYIIGDKNRISQVLINLITNGIKYSPDADKIDIRLSEDEGSVVICVCDYGIGIQTTNQKRIFEKFYRVLQPKKNNGDGFGLGLYICQEIVKQHGGKIWVESEIEKGSSFYVSLPIAN